MKNEEELKEFFEYDKLLINFIAESMAKISNLSLENQNSLYF
jgi:hypothetical protein